MVKKVGRAWSGLTLLISLMLILSSPNCSYLSNTSVTPNTSLWGNEKQVATLKQSYLDRTRNYNETDTNYDNQLRYYQSFSGKSQSFQDLYASVKQTNAKPYIDNVRHAEKTGGISTPLEYASVAASTATGTPVRTDFVDFNFNSLNTTAGAEARFKPIKVMVDVNAKSDRSPQVAYVNNTELYRARMEVASVLGFSENVSYGGTTGIQRASVTHPIAPHTIIDVDKTWSSLAPAELSMKVGYGINFKELK